MENYAIISGIISLVTLIVFFVMASNISAIRTILAKGVVENEKYIQAYNAGELKEFQGKKHEALDSYKEAQWYISKKGNNVNLQHKQMIEDKISQLTKS